MKTHKQYSHWTLLEILVVVAAWLLAIAPGYVSDDQIEKHKTLKGEQAFE